jgi:hypothetical protein
MLEPLQVKLGRTVQQPRPFEIWLRAALTSAQTRNPGLLFGTCAANAGVLLAQPTRLVRDVLTVPTHNFGYESGGFTPNLYPVIEPFGVGGCPGR